MGITFGDFKTRGAWNIGMIEMGSYLYEVNATIMIFAVVLYRIRIKRLVVLLVTMIIVVKMKKNKQKR